MKHGMAVILLMAASLGTSAHAGPYEQNVNRVGGDYQPPVDLTPRGASSPSYEAECEALCKANRRCMTWTMVKPNVQGPTAKCWLKDSEPPPARDNCCSSGIVRGDPHKYLCAAYADMMVKLQIKARDRKCEFINGKHGWGETSQDWVQACLSPAGRAGEKLSALKGLLAQCEAGGGASAGAGAGAGAAKVKFTAGNKVYKQPNGQDTAANTACTVKAGDTGDLIAKGADKGLDAHWVNVANISGSCGGKSGWIWDNGGELQLP